MSAPAAPSCANCVYRRRRDALIECRCESPRMDEDQGALWPIVQDDDWCGKWSGKRALLEDLRLAGYL